MFGRIPRVVSVGCGRGRDEGYIEGEGEEV